jgi:hypothetical protein
MDTAIKNCRISLATDLGDLYQSKIDLIHPYFCSRFPLMEREQRAAVVILSDLSLKKNIIFQPDQIIFNFGDSFILVDSCALRTDMEEIYNRLLLNHVVSLGTIKYIGIMDDRLHDAMKTSLTFQPAKAVDQAEGIGLRYLFTRDDNIWEYKIEPYLADKSCFYIEGSCTFRNFATDQVPSLIEQSYSFYQNRLSEFISHSLS